MTEVQSIVGAGDLRSILIRSLEYLGVRRKMTQTKTSKLEKDCKLMCVIYRYMMSGQGHLQLLGRVELLSDVIQLSKSYE